MTWEQPGHRTSRRARALATGAVATIVVLATITVGGPERAAPADPSPTADVDEARDAARVVEPTGAPGTASFVAHPLPDAHLWVSPRVGRAITPLVTPSVRLVAVDHRGLWTADTADGYTRRLRWPAEATSTGGSGGLWATSDRIVFGAGDSVVQVTGDDHPLRMFAAGHRLIPTVDADAVWVLDHRTRTASRVGLDGTVRRQVAIPASATPVVGTADELLVSASGALLRVAGDGSASLIATGDPVACDGDRLAHVRCTGDLSCAIVLGTLDQPDQRRVPLDPDERQVRTPSGRPAGAFSPDGRWLALPLLESDGDDGGVGIAVIDVARGVEVHRAAGPDSRRTRAPLAWTPDSRWLVHRAGRGIGAWDTATGLTRALNLGFAYATDLAVVPTR